MKIDLEVYEVHGLVCSTQSGERTIRVREVPSSSRIAVEIANERRELTCAEAEHFARAILLMCRKQRSR